MRTAIEKAVQLSIDGGYPWKGRGRLKIGIGREYEILLDPLFWHCLFGQKYGRIKALEFINHIFDGKTAEQYFEQVAGMGQKQQEEVPTKVSDLQEGGKETNQIRIIKKELEKG